ncbi:MAG: ATP-binding cassette domain-containing protein [Bacteroidota bacterium]|nr:ATP-binding cassette domain-containing protein [Bacteroidota bacterium]
MNQRIPIDIRLTNLSKDYNLNFIFSDLNFHIKSGDKLAILGSNGSGKSTLVQVIIGYLSPASGQVNWSFNEKQLPVEKWYKHLTLCTPYTELPTEFTTIEIFNFISKFKKPIYSIELFIKKCKLSENSGLPIKNFSSGMIQRLKLGLALLFDSSIVILDEPSSHLDVSNIIWYQNLIKSEIMDRTLIISSNIAQEYDFCQSFLDISTF